MGILFQSKIVLLKSSIISISCTCFALLMATDHDLNTRKHLIQLVLILVAGFVILLAVAPYDQAWTLYLNENQHEGFKQWMADSIFELEPIGGSDFALIYVILMFIAYLMAWHGMPNPEKSNGWERLKEQLVNSRHLLGYQVLVGLSTTFFLVHTSKLVMGRPRPYKVFYDGYVFSHWYEVGQHFISEGWYHGSFPSGHTATVFVVIALAYVLINHTNKKLHAWGWVVGAFAFITSVAMLVARSMSAAHWVTDSIGSIFFGWAIAHALYFFGVHMPFRSQHVQEKGQPFKVRKHYELLLAWYMFLACAGFAAMAIGLRAVVRWEVLGWAAGIPIGVALLYGSIKLLRKQAFFNLAKFKSMGQ